MDGLKSTIKKSLQVRLALVLSALIIAVALIAGGLSFYKSFKEAHELQDDILRQVAALMKQQGSAEGIAQAGGILHELDLDIEVLVQLIAPESSSISSGLSTASIARNRGEDDDNNKHHLNLPANLGLGLHTLDFKDDTYRVLVSQLPGGQHFVVAQETDLRDDLAYGSALRTVMPLLILIPLLIGLVFFLVGRMFKPIKRLSAQIKSRDEHDLSAIKAEHLPSEVQPFVQSINELLTKVDQSMQQQRRFVADAAHELRTPMTALSLQAEHLANAQMGEMAEQRLSELRAGIERSRHLLEQLLGLARAQEQAYTQGKAQFEGDVQIEELSKGSAQLDGLSQLEEEHQESTQIEGQTHGRGQRQYQGQGKSKGQGKIAKPVLSVRDIYRETLEDLMPVIDAKSMDIGVLDGPDVQVQMHKLELSTIVKNLVDNAIRYTPAQGQIDLSAKREGEWTVLEVSDSGPGIAVHERARVCEPFYRILGTEQQGSGLGLSIVHTLVKNAGGTLELLDAPDRQNGLLVRVRLPV